MKRKKEWRRICLLTPRQAQNFLLHNQVSSCIRGHVHMPRPDVEKGIESGFLLWISDHVATVAIGEGESGWFKHVPQNSARESGTVTMQMRRGGLKVNTHFVEGGLVSPR